MSDQAINKRSIQNVLINRPLQREFALAMLMIMMTAAFIVGFMIHSVLKNLASGTPPTLSRTAFEQIILDANTQLVIGSVLIIFLAVIAMGLFGVFFLHRVAGPVYRFHMVLSRLGHGEALSEIKLRQGDFFIETADSLNVVIGLMNRYQAILRTTGQLTTALKDKELPGDLKGKVTQVQEEIKELRINI